MRFQKPPKEKDNAQIFSNKFKILQDRSTGIARMEYELRDTDGNLDTKKLGIRILSCWVNRHTGNAIKVHMQANIARPSHAKFIDLIISSGKLEGREGIFTAERNGIVRFGFEPSANYGDCYTGYTDTFDVYNVYDSKAIAITAILNDLGRRLQVGGVQLINLDLVSDSVLEEVGFEQVPDLLRHSVSMWSGNPKDVVRAGGRNSWDQEKKNCESFLALLQQSLAPEGVSL